MFSIISFGNVRMSGMGKNLVTSYAALGVGLAVVLTFGLTAISSVMEQPVQEQFTVTDQDNAMMAQAGPEQAAERKALEAVPAESSESEPSQSYGGEEGAGTETGALPMPPASPEAQEDVGAQTGEQSGMGGETAAPMVKAPTQEETGRESYLIATDAPAASGSFAGILMALPYIAAAAVGSAVFAVTRKRVGW
jgi:hypothetical protein